MARQLSFDRENMSVERYFHWTCDTCGKVEIRQAYGFPHGWIFVKGPKVTHACPECAGSVPKHLHGYPQLIAKE
jgi:predicted RNA-binding Zn-ribbon protein involved in translation (DUF1610 family)